jgi:DnaJ-class molecular chaperone
MANLLTARNLPGIGNFDPPEDEDLPECSECEGDGRIYDPPIYGWVKCPDCNGTGYEPKPEYEPPMEREDS